MPELPEVETIRRQLAPRVVGRTVVDVDTHPSPKFAPARATRGATVTDLRRRGKYLLAGLDDGRELIVHLGMTGRLAVETPADDPPTGERPHLRAWWRFDDGSALTFTDIRRFGRLAVVPRGDHRRLPTLARLGPEPFDPTLEAATLHRALASSRRAVKTQLLSQRPVAGVGNIYADEALWDAGINPVARRLSVSRSARLLDALRAALASGLRLGGTTLRDYRDADGHTGRNQDELRCYGRAGQPCLRCGTLLRRRLVDGRGTTWCPRCQRR
ncbi:MAG: bifunctional DNA-formamidopyrimidine glycosylase/DNA-(apurinic or apyrimidinic site) lyase [Actinomyces sp.]|nr:MAG: bifunctional DNA-formamidopyrimidine glycosylase/DNA-(apurinic or apyrimidinic site) lyase [Actinomyces sp.]